ncbi:5-formyltetrahydrofolate cyclo-ligase [Streptomyces albiaxialis]|uniref:5-formyltetrahydrofolate cyclo-ligase n=1 Tax=Streptomyces albiaxialis TaxID=329523 RepID=A0ABN2VES1_9ACTN
MSELAAKRALRRDVLAARARLTTEDVAKAADALGEHALELPELAEAASVAAYVSIGAEPGTGPLLRALSARGTRVLLPVLLPDNDLDWCAYEGHDALVRAGRGLWEPSGTREGRDAVTRVDAVLLPGLAVDGRGLRLGRGGGSYDRALARIALSGASPARVVLLYDGEIVPRVPDEEHDWAVDAAITPHGVRRFGG